MKYLNNKSNDICATEKIWDIKFFKLVVWSDQEYNR